MCEETNCGELDYELVSQTLEDFFRKKPDASNKLPPVLEKYLLEVAVTGQTKYPWHKIRALFLWKLERAMNQFNEECPSEIVPQRPNVEVYKFNVVRLRILKAFKAFAGIPFTIQRLTEMLNNPRMHYKRADKFMNGLEKIVNVVTTIDPTGVKIVNELMHTVNGIDDSAYNGSASDNGGGVLADESTLSLDASGVSNDTGSEPPPSTPESTAHTPSSLHDGLRAPRRQGLTPGKRSSSDGIADSNSDDDTPAKRLKLSSDGLGSTPHLQAALTDAPLVFTTSLPSSAAESSSSSIHVQLAPEVEGDLSSLGELSSNDAAAKQHDTTGALSSIRDETTASTQQLQGEDGSHVAENDGHKVSKPLPLSLPTPAISDDSIAVPTQQPVAMETAVAEVSAVNQEGALPTSVALTAHVEEPTTASETLGATATATSESNTTAVADVAMSDVEANEPLFNIS